MPHVILTLGIRPDLIRASRIIHLLKENKEIQFTLCWSGQHYADNLKDVFIRDLELPPPDIELGATGNSDAEVVASVISRLSPVLQDVKPDVAVFLGDTNTVMGCIAAGQLNIPIVHIEGLMRSYDWRMPEEKYRTVIDHLSDVIYTYFDEYKLQGIREGINPRNVVVIQNLIVDVLNHYYFERQDEYAQYASKEFFSERGLERDRFYLMTCHRRESVESPQPLQSIMDLVAQSPWPVYFPASYRTQKRLQDFSIDLPPNVTMVDPIGYRELLALLGNSRGSLTDSGTVVEETAVLGVPSLQIRKATERPQVYDCGSSVKYDPARPEDYPAEQVFAKLDLLHGKTFDHGLGDGHASERLVADLVGRVVNGTVRGHLAENSHIDVSRSYREDGLPVP
ncbi:MAG: UDP-N-acetyl glucosamine 2-epimerase [Acidimicrobiales bacterium]|nr:UDP-N-acetyl glucosamine 2-epimerase [Acidimicrobiales bacterium]